MKWYKVDLHLHTILSPCGDLEMSPSMVAKRAKEEKIDILAITDHNSVANYEAYRSVLEKEGITAICGCEIQTAEEIHIIALFQNLNDANEFNKLLYNSLLPIDNDPDFFGDQVIINAKEEILSFEKKALINSSFWTYEETIENVRKVNGFCFPAHVDASSFSVIAQLGFLPKNPEMNVVGITAKGNISSILKTYPYLEGKIFLRNSDAHYLKDIGSGFTDFYLEEPTFNELMLAFKKQKDRRIKTK